MQEYKKPERAAIKAWRLLRAIALIVLIVIAGVIIAGMSLAEVDVRTLLIACAFAAVVLVCQTATLCIFPLIEYKQWKYQISDDKVEIIHGIFFIKRDIIPTIRMQNITIKQGPIYRRFGLFTVEIALASGTFEIVGLDGETAQEIADKLRAKLRERLQAKGVI